MNEIWTFDTYPNPEEFPECVITIDQTTNPPTVITPAMPDPATIGGADWRRLVELCFQRGEKVSNNIVEYEGLIAGLKAAAALGVKYLTIIGEFQLLVNFSNKVYEPKDEHM